MELGEDGSIYKSILVRDICVALGLGSQDSTVASVGLRAGVRR